MAYQTIANAGVTASLDDLVRRKLRVGDPNDPTEIAKALLSLYPEEKNRFEREAVGFSFGYGGYPGGSTPEAQVVTTLESDFTQAYADLEQDLNLLVSEPALRNVAAGLRGWAQAIRSAVNEGMAAARSALDPGQRDKVFGVRRTLGDYARLARYVGVLNIESNFKYRRLARSIDQISSLIFVQMGEAISKQAMSGFLMQVSLTEIQSRRAGVINSLRNLLGSLEASYDDETWGRGRVGYRDLYQALEKMSQLDLRVLLQEPELSRLMSELVDQTGRSGEDGLCALGATSAVLVDKMQRLILVADSLPDQQPPLVAFLEALQLFVDAFVDNRVGLRLVVIAKPSVTFYGSRYGTGMSGIDNARSTLIQLTFERSRLADLIDDYLEDDYSNRRIIGQIVMDKVLSDVDKAIDLYAQGTTSWGTPEKRSVAYAILLTYLTGITNKINTHVAKSGIPQFSIDLFKRNRFASFSGETNLTCLLEHRTEVKNVLSNISKLLLHRSFKAGDYPMILQEFNMQIQAEKGWLALVQSVVPSNFP
jgi:hypothetical protein